MRVTFKGIDKSPFSNISTRFQHPQNAKQNLNLPVAQIQPTNTVPVVAILPPPPPKHSIYNNGVVTGAAVSTVLTTGAFIAYNVLRKRPKAAIETVQQVVEKAPAKIDEIIEKVPTKINQYIETLAEGLSKLTGKNIKPKQLESVMSGDELLNTVPRKSRWDYSKSTSRIQEGKYKIDLHSHTNYSDGNGSIEHLLDQAAQQGDRVNAASGDKFILAITDHDTVDGTVEALKIISKDPDKYKNVRLVLGSEVSYAHEAPKSANKVETSEVLVYGINPFSQKVQTFFNNIKEKRDKMATAFINEVSEKFPTVKFSKEEANKFYGLHKMMNEHWKLNHYTQTKLAVTNIAKEQNKNPETLYEEIIKATEKGRALGNLKDENLIPKTIEENVDIQNIRLKYQSKIADDKLTTPAENTFEEIVNAFEGENDTFISLAHPYYLTERVNDSDYFVGELLKKSKGLLKATESYHQAYKPNCSDYYIMLVNRQCEDYGLVKVGGNDNHCPDLY